MTSNFSAAWAKTTPLLIFSCFCLLTGDVLFGYDTGSYGGILANPVSVFFPRALDLDFHFL